VSQWQRAVCVLVESLLSLDDRKDVPLVFTPLMLRPLKPENVSGAENGAERAEKSDERGGDRRNRL